MCNSLAGCESDLGEKMREAIIACQPNDDSVDYCALLPDTPASEVTKAKILKEISDKKIIGPATSPPPLTYLKSLYWTVMTLLTVGYGDMNLPGNDDIQ